jgi:hypothetical protein
MGDLVYLKSTTTPGHLKEKWREKWRGPFKVILTTPTAAKLAGFPSWVHVQSLKLAAPQKTYQSLLTGPTKIKISCFPRIPEDGSQKMETHPRRLPGCLGTWYLAYSLFILLLSHSFLSVPAHTFTLSYIHSTVRF